MMTTKPTPDPSTFLLNDEQLTEYTATIRRLQMALQNHDVATRQIASAASAAKGREVAAQRKADEERRAGKVRAIDALTADERKLLVGKIDRHGADDVRGFLRSAVDVSTLLVMVHADGPKAALAAKAHELGCLAVAKAAGKEQHEIIDYLADHMGEITVGEVEDVRALLPALARGSMDQRNQPASTSRGPGDPIVSGGDARRALAVLSGTSGESAVPDGTGIITTLGGEPFRGRVSA